MCQMCVFEREKEKRKERVSLCEKERKKETVRKRETGFNERMKWKKLENKTSV